MIDVGSYAIRVILVFLFTYFAARILSKKAISEMTAYEMAGIIILSTVAAEPLVTKVTTKAIFGTGLTAILIFIVSRLSLLNGLAPILEHTPTVVVRNGEPDLQALRNTTLSFNQLYGLLRTKGYSKMSDVEYAILEPQGKISIIPKSQKRPIQPSDLNIPTQYEGLTLPLIIDGAIIEPNLRHARLEEAWLRDALVAQGVTNPENVSTAELDTQGNLTITKIDKKTL